MLQDTTPDAMSFGSLAILFGSLLVAGLFVVGRFISITRDMSILGKQLNPDVKFNFQTSWVANLSLISALFALVLKAFDPKDVQDVHVWTVLSILFAMLLAWAVLTYVSGNGFVLFFLLGDLLAIWSVIGSSVSLIPMVFELKWFPAIAQALVSLIVVISLIQVGALAWRTMGELLKAVVKAAKPPSSSPEEPDKRAPADKLKDVSWSVR